MRMMPTMMPTTTMVMSCDAVNVRAETVLPVIVLFIPHSKVEQVWYNCLQLGHIGPGGWWQRYRCCILYQLWDPPPKEFKFMKWSHLYSLPYLKTSGWQREVAITDEHTLGRFHQLVMQLAWWHTEVTNEASASYMILLQYLGGTQTARSPTALGQLEDDQEAGEPRWILIL